MIAIIDYKTGNIQSVSNALSRVGVDYLLTDDPKIITQASKVILPGVGQAGQAMDNLQQSGLVSLIKSLTQPVLGICVGMQIMCKFSEEEQTSCLGLFEVSVKKFDKSQINVPHMGWNSIYDLNSPILTGVNENDFVYYVHSFAPEIGQHTVAKTDYQHPFSAVLQRDNFFGTQFHPEKSGDVGATIIKNFITL